MEKINEKNQNVNKKYRRKKQTQNNLTKPRKEGYLRSIKGKRKRKSSYESEREK